MTSESGRDERLNEILAEYIQAVEAGATPDKEQFLAQHAEFVDELREFFDDKSRFDRMADPFKPSGEEEATPIDEAATLVSSDGRSESRSSIPAGPGSKLRYFGDYELLEEIARGGMGVVYKARQSTLKRIVALKMILSGQLAGEEEVRRFYSEAEAAAKLDHPNIVPIFEIGEREGQHYFSMAFVAGESLARKIVGGPLPSRESAQLIKKVTDAVAYAHIEGVVHRDLKPANVLLDQDGEPRVTDFGLAKRISAESLGTEVAEAAANLTATGQILGTPNYMPPEQAAGRSDEVGVLSDVYSLGAMLYCLLTGRPPFQAASPLDTLMQVMEKDPVPVRQLDPNVSRDLETICLKCLEKDPRRRYASARELSEDLGRFLNDEPILARRPSLIEQVSRGIRRNRRSALIAVTTTAVSAMLALVLFLLFQATVSTRMGHMHLESVGTQLQVEILDPEQERLVDALHVRGSETLSLPEGEYRMRVSVPGLPSVTSHLDVERGVDSFSHSIGLRPQWLHPPREVGANTREEVEEVEILDLDSQADLIQLIGIFEPRVQRLDGLTGRPVWDQPLVCDAANLPDGAEIQEWMQVLQRNYVSDYVSEHNFVRPPPDLNQDGTRDLVFLSRETASLLAVSGANGEILWWFRSPDDPNLIGAAMVAEVDDDGTPDLIAPFADGGSLWVEAVSGNSGQSLWRKQVESEWIPDDQRESWAGDGSRTGYLVPIRDKALCGFVSTADQTVLVVLAGSHLLGLDVNDGSEAWPAKPLGFIPQRRPDLVDLDGDGQQDALIPHVAHNQLNVTALSLKSLEPLWTVAVRPAFDLEEYPQEGKTDWALEDLDGDGRPEVILPIAEDWNEAEPRTRSTDLSVLDGRTGRPRWQQRVWLSRDDVLLNRILTGPDLDGDGHREIFLAWFAQSVRTEPVKEMDFGSTSCFVAAISGQTGHTLWRWEREISVTELLQLNSFDFWAPDHDGFPLLVHSLGDGLPGRSFTGILSSRTGELVSTIEEVSETDTADFNGDGLRDLIYTHSPGGITQSMVIPGLAASPWRRLGHWSPTGDFDDDGYTDFVGGDPLRARSGRDGTLLWQSALSVRATRSTRDLNGDHVHDLLAGRTNRERAHIVRAISGTDGEELWAVTFDKLQAGSFSTGQLGGYRYPLRQVDDLDGGGNTEVFTIQTDGTTFLMALLRSHDGGRLWDRSFQEDSQRRRVSWLSEGHSQFGRSPRPNDVNGDGVRDFVLWLPQQQAGQDVEQLNVISGATGEDLWVNSPLTLTAEDRTTCLPAVGQLDEDDALEIVTTTQKQGESLVAVTVVDGETGEVQWTWSDLSYDRIGLPTLLVDLNGDGIASVCFGVRDENGARITVLSGDGSLQGNLPLDLRGYDIVNSVAFSDLAFWWKSADLDGDGREELLYYNAGALCASHDVEGSVSWNWTLPSKLSQIGLPTYGAGNGQIVAVQPATEDSSATVVVWIGQTVYGIDGATGKPSWRCETSVPQTSGQYGAPKLSLISTAHGLPRVLCRPDLISIYQLLDTQETVCRQAYPTTPAGRYLPPAAQAQQYEPLSDLGSYPRLLPWVAMYAEWSETLFLGTIILPVVSLIVVVLPILFCVWAWRERSRVLGILSVVYILLSITLYAMYSVSVDRPGDLDGVPVPLQALLGLPSAVLFMLFVQATIQRRWRRVGFLVVAVVIATILVAVGELAGVGTIRNTPTHPLEHYIWDGWYWVFFYGAWYAGIVIGLILGALWLVRLLRRWRRASPA